MAPHETGKSQFYGEGPLLDILDEEDLVDDEEECQDPSPVTVTAYGPDYVVVVENTFLTVRPTTPESSCSRRAKSTPASSRPASSRRCGVKGASSPVSTGSTTASCEFEVEEVETPPLPAATFGGNFPTYVNERTNSLVSSWGTEAWSSDLSTV